MMGGARLSSAMAGALSRLVLAPHAVLLLRPRGGPCGAAGHQAGAVAETELRLLPATPAPPTPPQAAPPLACPEEKPHMVVFDTGAEVFSRTRSPPVGLRGDAVAARLLELRPGMLGQTASPSSLFRKNTATLALCCLDSRLLEDFQREGWVGSPRGQDSAGARAVWSKKIIGLQPLSSRKGMC
ncbi:hypothetical protein BS78_02G063100 [Paspalum vaginatum]|nr:hypothetical protein BS78_02G063100 [Paspalum vaginatum]